jgi:hypothetical protein
VHQLLFESRCARHSLLVWWTVLFNLFAEERAFESERIGDVELLEDDHSRGRLLTLFESEPALFQIEKTVLLAAHQWDKSHLRILDSPFLFIILEAAPVEECILLPRVAVQITKQNDFPILVHRPDEALRIKNSWVEQSVGPFPPPVEIAA